MQSNHHFSWAVSVDAPTDAVWDQLVDVATWPAWDTEIREAKLDSPFAVGATGSLVPKTGPNLRFAITAVDPGNSYTFVTKMPVGTLAITRKLETTQTGATFTDDIRFTGLLRHVFGALLGRGFRRVLPGVMDNFKRLVEANRTS